MLEVLQYVKPFSLGGGTKYIGPKMEKESGIDYHLMAQLDDNVSPVV